MVDHPNTNTGRLRLIDHLHARSAARAKPATAFKSTPEPKMIGKFARGRQLLAGNFLFSGHLIEAPGVSIWDAAARVDTATETAQGFRWLDDLAAVGDNKARIAAQLWTHDWIDAYGGGTGPAGRQS